MRETSTIAETAKAFKECCDLLQIPVTLLECEGFGRFLSAVYGTENRAFHHLQHALEVSEDCSPAGRIAALFHDVVYKQVDHAKLPELNSCFGIFDPGQSLELTIPNEKALANQPWALALITLFEMKPAQTITPLTGMNEFLSAWVAIQKCSRLLSPAQLLHVIACIEATIPFRGEQENPSVSEKLKSKIEFAAQMLNIKLNANEVVFIVKDAVKISNNDVRGFTRSIELFIHDSWALLYESNRALQNEFYTLAEYRAPLAKLELFLGSMNPKKIFIRYQDYPSTAQVENDHLSATKNLRLTQQYMRAKLVDVAILEAFAKISGGDCPLDLFAELLPRVENHLKHVVPKRQIQVRNANVRSLLGNERIFKSSRSLETTLFGTFIYDSLTESQAEETFAAATEFFNDRLSAENFLHALPENLVLTVGELLSSLAWTRAPAIQAFVHSHPHPQKKSTQAA